MTLARERDQWFWVGYGDEAVAMARDCGAVARRRGRSDLAIYWDYWMEACRADPDMPLKIQLPKDFPERRLIRTGYSQKPWWKGL